MLTSAVLLREMLSPRNRPMVTNPLHCLRSVSRCLQREARYAYGQPVIKEWVKFEVGRC